MFCLALAGHRQHFISDLTPDRMVCCKVVVEVQYMHASPASNNFERMHLLRTTSIRLLPSSTFIRSEAFVLLAIYKSN